MMDHDGRALSYRKMFDLYRYLILALVWPGSGPTVSMAFVPPRPQPKSTPRVTVARAASVSAAEVDDRRVVRRTEYEEPPFWITHVDMDVGFEGTGGGADRGNSAVSIASRLKVARNERTNPGEDRDLVLDGDAAAFSLRSLSLDGRNLEEGTEYEVTPSSLRIKASRLRGIDLPTLDITVDWIGGGGSDNTLDLEGLYYREGFWCTHCEATEFSKITYFLDRPDNTAVFESVRIEADKAAYPTMLSNGNLVDSGDCGDRRHYVVYSDPHPKPCYIFGLLVAGAETNLECLKDTYTSEMSGREVKLQVYGSSDKLYRLTFAMESLKKAMAWEEETFGLEYDLDVYTIVALRHYSIGAMENKGLNFFLESLVAADPITTTDVTYGLIEKTIAHEYLHNWTGNRVTVRDWFEMALKEGLTVYRDQEFCANVGQRTAVRIETVKNLRAKQFVDDAASDSQPVRAESYMTIEDLWSPTAYHKGAEICRMYKSILGPKGFRRGLRLYTSRHDGTGATLDDLNQAMADANIEHVGDALDQFALWFFTPGTPTVTFEHSYAAGTFTLKLSQTSRSTDGPLLIPVAFGLMDRTNGEKEVVPTTTLNLKEESQIFQFEGLDNDVVPSLLRDFSAPVNIVPASGEEDVRDVAFRGCYDTDLFNRYEACQKLYKSFINKLLQGEDVSEIEEHVHNAFESALHSDIDPSSKAYILQLPTEFVLHRESEARIDPDGIHESLMTAKRTIARKFKSELRDSYDRLQDNMPAKDGPAKTDAVSRADRALQNVFLDYLCSVFDTPEEKAAAAQLAMQQFDNGSCLTDKLFAFRKLVSMDGAAATARDASIEKFYELSKQEPSLIIKWFQTQALSDLPDVLERVQALTQHPSFKATNGPLFRALIVGFTLNLHAFHHKSGAGYRFIGSICSQIDRVSPSLSVALASKLAQWQRFDEQHSQMMLKELKKLASTQKSQSLASLLKDTLPPSDGGAGKSSQPRQQLRKASNKKKSKPGGKKKIKAAKPKKAAPKGGFGSR